MKRIYLSFLLSFLILLIPASAQRRSELKEMFFEAESYFLFEEYNEALPLYRELLKHYPDNDNLKYRIGICYLNTPGQKDKSINYLEKTINNIDPKYKEGSFRETSAPLDAYFYLGNAYRINNMLNKAIETYEHFRDNINEKIYEISVVEHQIGTCQNAIKLQKSPVFISYVNLGGTINTRFSDFSPVISGDETTLIYTQKLQFYDAIFYSNKINGKWTEPRNLTPELQVDRDFYSASLSYDGKTLYLYLNDDYDGNIYVSYLEDDHWTSVEKLNDNINTRYWESHACPTKDGNTLYFTSNRKGGYGSLDIYKSEKDSTGNWGPATNLGPTVNTEYNEETPFITPDGKTLYFSSYGHFNMGGYDIFYVSQFDNGEWSTPLNMGYPINTADDDIFYVPVGEGYFAFYSKFSESGYGEMDIFRLEIFSDEHPRKFRVNGIVSLAPVPSGYQGQISIHVIESLNYDTVNYLSPSSTGEYVFVVPAGEYDLNYKANGFEDATEHVSISKNQKDSIVSIPVKVLALSDLTADLEVMDSILDISKTDSVEIDLEVEPGSILLVQIFDDKTLISSEEFFVTDSTFTYKYLAEPGDQIIKFTLTDKFGNTASKDVTITTPLILAVVHEELEDKTEEDTIVTAFIVSPEVREFKNRLSIYATGGLEEVLDSIDLQKEKIGSPHDLVLYLNENADKYDYSPDDVDTLLWHAASRNDPNADRFLRNIKHSASGDVALFLGDLQLKEQDINNVNDLRSHLKTAENAGAFTKTSLHQTLERMVLAEYGQLASIQKNLDSIATGNIKEALSNLDTKKEKIYSAYDLIEFLRDNAGLLGYTEEELAILLAKLAANGNPSVTDFYNRFLYYTYDGLRRGLDELDLKKEKVKTIPDLIRYLLNSKEKYQYTSSDLMNALIDMISETDIDMARVKELISEEEKDKKGIGTVGKILLLLAGIGAIFIFILFYRRRKKDNEAS